METASDIARRSRRRSLACRRNQEQNSCSRFRGLARTPYRGVAEQTRSAAPQFFIHNFSEPFSISLSFRSACFGARNLLFFESLPKSRSLLLQGRSSG